MILRSAWFKGKLGEFKVNVGVTLLLDRKIYRLVKNITLPVGGETTQIDHLVVSPYGVFVIETKNIKGWIFGQPNRAQWTQVIYRFKQRFQNPLLQNNMHVKAVRDLLGLEPDQVHNVVVFVGTCTFKTPMPAEVVRGVFSLAGFIRAKRVLVFTEDEVRRFIEDILNKRLDPGFRTERTHVRNVKRRISDNAADSGIACPRCGGVMVERLNSGTGERFLGCRRFPRCGGARSLP
ncbi:MAG: nuclease [Rhodospirillales bacterium]|nr:nuclease [Rhodospirillales bacterium]